MPQASTTCCTHGGMSNQGRTGLTEASLERVPAKPNGKLDMQKSNDLAGCREGE